MHFLLSALTDLYERMCLENVFHSIFSILYKLVIREISKSTSTSTATRKEPRTDQSGELLL